MYHFNPSFFETATNLFNAVVVPQNLRSLIQFLISHEHNLDQKFIWQFECFYQHALVKFYIPTEATKRALPRANLCLAILAYQHSPFLLTFFSLSTPLYTGTLNISFVHIFSSIAQSQTPSLKAVPQEKRLLLLTQLNS